MFYLSSDAENSFNELFYYPYTIGKHLQRAISDVDRIIDAINHLPIGAPGVPMRRVISRIGTFTYMTTRTGFFIDDISWSTVLTRFYYVKSNFIRFNSRGNIPSVHPSLYRERHDASFKCDNGFKVVSRIYRGREVFNFRNLDGRIISDIDFKEVKPFSEFRDMTARGYTPNRRCYMVFEDGCREEVNEQVSRIKRIVNESIRDYLKENLIQSKIK